MKTFCPNCEKETECTFTCEVYSCNECNEDYATYEKQKTNNETLVDAASKLLESISKWFWKNQGLQPDPMWVDEFKSVCQLFEPSEYKKDE